MSKLVSCGKSILIHDHTPEPILTINPHKSTIYQAIWNHNNFVIASAGQEGTIKLSHAHKGENLLTLNEDHAKSINALAFTSNSQYLACGGQDALVRIWDLKKKEIYSQLKGHYSAINSLSWNPLDSLIASASNVGDIIVHDVATNYTVATFNNPDAKTPGFKSIRFMPFHKSYLASGANDGILSIWDLNSKERVHSFQSHNSKITGISCSPIYQNMIASVGTDQKINIYNLSEKKCTQSIYVENPLNSISYSNDGVSVAVGTLYGQIYVYDTRMSQKAKVLFKGHENTSVNYLEYQHLTEEEKTQRTLAASSNSISLKESNMSSKLQSQNESLISQKSISSNVTKKQQYGYDKESMVNIEQQKQQQLEQLHQITKKTQIQSSSSQQFSQQKTNFEMSTSKIEDITRKYDKGPTMNLEGGGFNEEQKKYLSGLMNEQMYQMKQLVVDQVGSMHIDMIRQFQLQYNELEKLLEKQMNQQSQLVQRISQLEQENYQLKKQSY